MHLRGLVSILLQSLKTHSQEDDDVLLSSVTLLLSQEMTLFFISCLPDASVCRVLVREKYEKKNFSLIFS